MVPPSGNLWIGGQQIWLGPALAGRTITIWASQRVLHVLLEGIRIKTLPSRLGITELARLDERADRRRPGRTVDVAGLAGVSKSSVSRVLQGSPLVSEEARAAVLAAITELGEHTLTWEHLHA